MKLSLQKVSEKKGFSEILNVNFMNIGVKNQKTKLFGRLANIVVIPNITGIREN